MQQIDCINHAEKTERRKQLMLQTEIYRITFEHIIFDSERRKHDIEQPLVAEMVVDRKYNPMPRAFIVNEMFDMLRNKMIEVLRA